MRFSEHLKYTPLGQPYCACGTSGLKRQAEQLHVPEENIPKTAPIQVGSIAHLFLYRLPDICKQLLRGTYNIETQ
jgi:hypothetical protein